MSGAMKGQGVRRAGFGRGALAVLLSMLVAVAFLWLLPSSQAQSPADAPRFETDRLEIETSAGERHAFEVELAVTRDQQAFGLMFRRELAADAGMLFLHPRERSLSMWMKNTYIPLDMLFIDAEGTIVSIAERTVPQSLSSIRSGQPALAVLEVNGGTASRLGIALGDRVIHEAFGTE